MKICFITLGHVSKTRGGIDRVTDVLAQAFIQKGHCVSMVSLWQPITGDCITDCQFFLPSPTIVSSENKDFLKNYIREHDIDILINQSDSMELFNLLVSIKGRTPLVSVIHTDPIAILKDQTDQYAKLKYKKGKVLFYSLFPYFACRWVYQYYTRKQYIKNKYLYYYEQSSAVVLLSDRFKPIFKRLISIDDDRKLFSIANPFSFSKAETQKKKERLILFVGRLDFQKRLDRLFKAWSKIKDKNGWHLAVLGEGSDEDFYKDLAEKMKISEISFEGLVDPLPYYEKASILCVTSTHEGFSLAISEGLQQEVIPLAFNSYEAVYDLINSGNNGYIIPAFSIKKYSKCLKQLITNEELREQMRLRIRENNILQNKFDIEVIVNKWTTLFEKIR